MSLKHAIREAIDVLANLTGTLKALEGAMRGRLTILTYHRILPVEKLAGYPLRGLVVPAEVFPRHVELLASRYRVLPVTEALCAAWGEDARNAPPVLAITFDDGYFDNHDIAAPILDARGIRATFFVTSDFVEHDQRLWFDRAALLYQHHAGPDLSTFLAARLEGPPPVFARAGDFVAFLKTVKPQIRASLLDQAADQFGTAEVEELYRPMTVHQLRSLADRGHEIASHTLTHPILTQLSDEEARKEIALSKARLELLTGRQVEGLCFPNGNCDERIVTATRSSGYRYACTVEPGHNAPGESPFELRRIDVTPDSIAARSRIGQDSALLARAIGLRATLRRVL